MNVIRLVVNWMVLLTAPVWILPCFFFQAVSSAPDDDTHDRFISGKKWCFK